MSALARVEPLLCPRCSAPMRELPGFPGLWRCTRNDSHEFVEDRDFDPPMAYAEHVAHRHWIHSLAEYGPLGSTPQSNADGTMAMPGAVKRSGGSKSSRKRRKARKMKRDPWPV